MFCSQATKGSDVRLSQGNQPAGVTSQQQKDTFLKITVSRTLPCETKQEPQVTQVGRESELFALLTAPSPQRGDAGCRWQGWGAWPVEPEQGAGLFMVAHRPKLSLGLWDAGIGTGVEMMEHRAETSMRCAQK